jgi:hypothetical protein
MQGMEHTSGSGRHWECGQDIGQPALPTGRERGDLRRRTRQGLHGIHELAERGRIRDTEDKNFNGILRHFRLAAPAVRSRRPPHAAVECSKAWRGNARPGHAVQDG